MGLSFFGNPVGVKKATKEKPEAKTLHTLGVSRATASGWRFFAFWYRFSDTYIAKNTTRTLDSVPICIIEKRGRESFKIPVLLFATNKNRPQRFCLTSRKEDEHLHPVGVWCFLLVQTGCRGFPCWVKGEVLASSDLGQYNLLHSQSVWQFAPQC